MLRFLAAAALALLAAAAPAQAERIKDLGTFQGVRTNQLTGYGIVVGLAGTGDDSLEYATLGMRGAVSRLGLTLPAGVNPTLKNAAAVMITADLPAFARPGQKLDITVSAIGKARSLRGGTLVVTPLQGADGQIYAMAQGNLAVGGLGISGQDGSNLTVNIPTAGRIPGGATVERAVDTGIANAPELVFNLSEADFTTAGRVAMAINAVYPGRARALDAVSVAIQAAPGTEGRTALMGAIENLPVNPAEAAARVIVNARTGTVVINGAVRISPAAITHGKLTVRIDEEPQVSQPAPFSRGGQTVVTPSSSVSVEEERHPMFDFTGGASLSEIVRAVNAIGATPADLVAILEALKQAGAMRAELVVL